MKELVIATKNKGKIEEFRAMLEKKEYRSSHCWIIRICQMLKKPAKLFMKMLF